MGSHFSTKHEHLTRGIQRSSRYMRSIEPDDHLTALVASFGGATATYKDTYDLDEEDKPVPTGTLVSIRLGMPDIFAEIAEGLPQGEYEKQQKEIIEPYFAATAAIERAIKEVVKTSPKIKPEDRFLFDSLYFTYGDIFRHNDALIGKHAAQHAQPGFTLFLPYHNDPRAALDFLKSNLKAIQKYASQFFYADLIGESPSQSRH